MLGQNRKFDGSSTIGKAVERRTRTRRAEDYFWLLRVTEITGDCALVVNREMQVEFIDPRLLQMLAIDHEAAEHISDFSDIASHMAHKGCFGEGDPKAFQALMWDLLTNQRLKQSRASEKITGVTPLGRHLEITLTYGRDDRFILLFRDVTDDWVDDQIIKTALELGNSGYWYFNLDTKRGYINAELLRPLLDEETFNLVTRKGLKPIMSAEDYQRAHKIANECVTSGEDRTLSFRISDKNNGEHWIRCKVSSSLDQKKRARITTGFFTNITEEQLHQNELQKAREDAEKALETRDSFMGRMSHEVRTPMNAVIGLADAIIHQGAHQELEPKLRLIQESAEKVVMLVDETLQHSKLENNAIKMNPRLASPKKVAKTVAALWEVSAEKNGSRLSVKIAPTVPDTLFFDDFRYEQCVNNLVGNAVKFTKDGHIQIIMTVQGAGPSAQLVLAVRDTGIGMSEAQSKMIFDPFTQADDTISSRFGGTGLGLSITKSIVEMMGGRITVKSEPGVGSIFLIAVPIKQEERAEKAMKPPAPAEAIQDPSNQTRPLPAPAAPVVTPRPVPTPTAPQPSHDNHAMRSLFPTETPSYSARDDERDIDEPRMDERGSDTGSNYAELDILIVDDNQTNHLVVGSLLEDVVGNIVTAMNGEEAIEALEERAKSNKPMFDLVLMDIHMPVMDGIEATLAIRSQPSAYEDIPIIALTADPQYQQSHLCKNIGMNEALAKPIRLKKLTAAFDQIIEETAAAAAA